MDYLLDTHAIIWSVMDDKNLSQKVRDLIYDPGNSLFISATSLWEIAIKIAINKLDVSFDKLLIELKRVDFSFVQVEASHLVQLLKLPFIHKDPFDRLLIATAKTEIMTLVTADENIQKYDISWVW